MASDQEQGKESTWDKVQRRTVFSASLVVLVGTVLGGATVVYQFTAKRSGPGLANSDVVKDFFEDVYGKSAGPQSPIRVVGGSIKLKAAGGWKTKIAKDTCLSIFDGNKIPAFKGHVIQDCIYSVVDVTASGVTSLSLAGVDLPDGATTTASGWLGLGTNWTVTAFAKGNPDGDVKTNLRGVDICMSNGTLGLTGTKIAIAVFDNSKTPATSLAPDPSDSGNTTLFRYHDANYDGKPDNPFESMGQINVTVGSLNTYICTDGACQIFIGN
jgi:hypothetical protein